MESTVTRHGVPRGHESAAQTEADAVEPGTRVDGFRVQRRLGAGAMGEVYLAQDVTLGRWVALKLVKRQWMEPEGLERFLEEARVTASFSHPNIVTVHAFGQFHERPYLALEFLDGESLRERLSRGPLAEREALRVAKAIAEGIAEAHSRGLVHADLKPSNVVIPKDGRVRIVDFGLARMVGSPGGAASGTHEYMAPERWSGAAPTAAIDVWALGLMLGEMIEGKRSAPTAGAATPAWQRLAHRCLADDPKARPSSAELVRALTTLCEPGSAAADRSPYRGLAAFTADDQSDYLGRATELDAVAELMRASPVVPIAGPSGIGKSSFVEAALVPRLAELAAWRVLRCRPGARPLEQLAAALGGGAALATELRQHPEALGLHLGKESRRALLLIDQAEEAFTLAAEEAPAFFACLASLSSDDPSRVVLTVRDDFLGRLAAIEKMRRHLSALVVLGPLSRADLETAIRKPLERVGYSFDDPALPQRIAADVERQPAGLALLQFACQALWERRDEAKKQLLAHEYEAMRGPGGALAAHAERFLSQLPPEQVRWVRQVLLSLVNADGTRRPRPSHEVLEGLPPAAAQLVDRLLAARLVVAQRKADGDTATLELAHEALTTTWPQLSRWLDETHELRALVQEVDLAAQVWERRARASEATWQGTTLLQVSARVAEWKVELPKRAREFLDAGLERQQRAQRRSRRLLIGGGSALAAVAVGATFAAFAFQAKEQEAVRQQAQIRLAAADLGRFELVLTPFERTENGLGTQPATKEVPLEWSLRAPDLSDLHSPGRLLDGDELRRGGARRVGSALHEQVEARSGPAFLEVKRAGCATVMIELERLPGYTERAEPPKPLELPVPSCAASAAGMISIAKGPFFRNVDRPGGHDDTDDEQAELDGFAIDRTEVTRGAFAVYEGISALTGDSAAPAGNFGFEDPGKENLPIVGVNFKTARDYCRFMGKDLPSLDQWQKAVRGGLTVNGAPNPNPKRDFPWVGDKPHAANLRGVEDGSLMLAPVGTSPADVSPYGVMDLAGNVSEWTLGTPDSSSKMRRLRIVGGANWDTAPELSFLQKVTFRSTHPDPFIDYALGFRCARPLP